MKLRPEGHSFIEPRWDCRITGAVGSSRPALDAAWAGRQRAHGPRPRPVEHEL